MLNLLFTVSSLKIDDIDPPPTKLTPGKALPLTVTDLETGYLLQAGVCVKVG